MAEERLFRVRGRVQGVGFRAWTRAHARRLGLPGTVRNCPDGSVEVTARGSDADLSTLRALLQAGPAGAVVTEVSEHPASGVPAASFEILH